MTDNLAHSLTLLDSAARENKLSAGAVQNIRAWLTEPRYSAYRPQVMQHLSAGLWRELDDVFWTVIPFGTGGRRGRMYPIGSNAINERTMGESAQGLAEYVKKHAEPGRPLACAVAYDTRHRSTEFARLCAEIMAAAGFCVYFLQPHRATPELSFLVRWRGCSCGIMITASHNPPSDNAIKAYWSTGGQLLPPHDQGVIDCVMQVDQIERIPFEQACARGSIVMCGDDVDRAYQAAVASQRFSGPRAVRVIYSPLHGVGETAVIPVLLADQFTDVEVYAPHREPDGDFPNVPGHVANPENPPVFEGPVQRAREVRADLVLATDPDCDRMGCAAPVSSSARAEWKTLDGNQLGALLADYILEQRRRGGTLTPDHYIVKTLVTSEMIRRIADSYGVKTYGDLMVGFKWIGQVIDEKGPDRFVYGCEESHGFLVGQYARDKDGAVACMLLAELAAALKANGQTLHEKLDALYWQHGYHAERLLNLSMPGSEGMAQMQMLMRSLRESPPRELAGMPIRGLRDYLSSRRVLADGSDQTLEGPVGDLVMLDLAETGNFVAVRPSGTEPKVKFYMFAYIAPEQLGDLDEAKQRLSGRIDSWQQALRALV